MWAFLERLLDSSTLSPHGICLLWQPELIWLHVLSDAVIAASYFSIPVALSIFVSKRRDVDFGWVLWAFAIFIMACGFTHVLSIITLWVPVYGIEGIVKVLTAMASIVTAVMLWPLLPKVLALPSPSQLRSAELALAQEGRQRREAEDMLRHAQEMESIGQLLRAVVDTAVDGVILIDARGIVQKFNPACEKLFKYQANEVIGNNVRMLMPAPYRAEHDGYIRNFLATGEKKIIGIGREVIGRRKDGTTFPMELSVGEAKQDGDSIFVGMIHDLTDRKRTEAQLIQAQKMEAVGQLSGGIAHDFNNLLTVIVGNAEHLSEQLVARHDLKRLSDDICSAGERGAELTQRLLAFGRKQLLRPVEVECNRLLETMHKLLRRTLREDVEITTHFDPELRLAFADPAQLESAILNLALNAQDAMPAGGRLSLSTADASLDRSGPNMNPDVRAGDYVVIAVTDNGEGMPKAVLDRAFEPFFTTKEVGKGSGLGLSMVYGFARQSNGHVSIYSDPGLGTTVRIYLPAMATKENQAMASPDSEVPQRGAETVLVVEDDPFVRSYAVLSLQSLGYQVVSAVDGKEALQKLAADSHVDLLFADIVMPGGVNGWELAKLARKARPQLRVLLTSGYAMETLAANGRLQDGALVLQKPYRKAELARRLRDALSMPLTPV